MIAVAAVYWNIWKEKNRRIFSYTAFSYHCCPLLIHSDIIVWTGLLSEEEQVHLSDDDLFKDIQTLHSEEEGRGNDTFPMKNVWCMDTSVLRGRHLYFVCFYVFGVCTELIKRRVSSLMIVVFFRFVLSIL